MQGRPPRFCQPRLFAWAGWFALISSSAFATGRFEALGGLPQGCNGPINTMIETAQGDVVVAGAFTVCGDTAATGVARFNGKRWFKLGSGIPGEVRALAIIGADIYAAGAFDRAGEVLAPGVARFDGVRWWPLGTGSSAGLSGEANVIASFEGKLYVAGYFNRAGNIQTPGGFAVWDGSNWALPPPMPGSAVNSSAEDLSVHNGELFVSGSNGTLRLRGNTWSPLPTGGNRPSDLRGIVSDGSRLYGFPGRVACLIQCDFPVFQFDGSNWSNIGNFDSSFSALAVVNGELYASGSFRGLRSGPAARNLARRRNNVWEAVEIGALGTVGSRNPITNLLAHRGTLLAAGSFTSIGEATANRIARFHGSGFSSLGNALGNGLNGTVRAIAGLDGDTFVAGDFDQAGRTQAGGVAVLAQGQWQSLHKQNSSRPFSVAALLNHQNQLFAAGSFEGIGASTANSVARLEAGFWRTLPPGTGISAGALAMASIGSDLYIVGNFAQAALGSPSQFNSRGIARFQANQLGIVGDGFASGSNGTVRAIASLNGDTLVAGRFTTAGGLGDPISNIARFDGSRFYPLAVPPGSPPLGEIRAMATFRGQIYVAAVTPGIDLMIQLARWDGASLQPFGPPFRSIGGFYSQPQINAMVVHADRLYVGGRFDQVGDIAASGAVVFDGSSWRPLGQPGARDIQGEVLALASAGDSLLIGGQFGLAGGQVSSNAVRYLPELSGQSAGAADDSQAIRE